MMHTWVVVVVVVVTVFKEMGVRSHGDNFGKDHSGRKIRIILVEFLPDYVFIFTQAEAEAEFRINVESVRN